MTYLKSSIIFLILFYFIFIGTGISQSQGQIKGIVTSTESFEALEGAIITLDNTTFMTRTGRNGLFTIRDVPFGQYKLRVSLLGFNTDERQITVSASGVTEIRVLLNFSEIREEIIVIGKRHQIQAAKTLLEHKLSNTEDLLESVEGISMVRKGNTSFDPVIRGMKADRINVTIDGMKIFGACRGRMDPPTTYLEIGELDNIEITKGPNSVTMGANNLGGNINLISKKPRQYDKPTLKGSSEAVYYSAAKGKKGKLELSGGSKFYGFRVNTSYQDYGNYRSGEGVVENSGFKRVSYGTYLDIYPDKNKTIAFSLIGNLGRDTGYPALPMDSEKDDALIASVGYTQKNLSKNWLSFTSKIYFNKVYHVMNNRNRSTFSMRDAEGIGETKTFGGHLINGFAFGNALVTLGMDFYQTNGDATRTVINKKNSKTMIFKDWPDAFIRDLGIFAQYYSAMTPRLYFRLGLRGDFSHSTAKAMSTGYANFWQLNSDPKNSSTGFTGNVSLTYQINENFTIAGLLGRGTRKPGINEYYSYYGINRFDIYDYIGSPDLEDETNTNVELQLKYVSPVFHFRLSTYRNLINNYIMGTIRPDLTAKTMGAKGVKVYGNLGHASITGIEGNWMLRMFSGLHLMGNLSYMKGVNKENNGPLPEIAPFEATLGLKYNNVSRKFWVQASARFVAKQNRVSILSGEDQTPGFNLFDLRLGYTGFKHFHIFAGIENIFDQNYHEHLNRNNILSPGRNIYLGIKTLF